MWMLWNFLNMLIHTRGLQPRTLSFISYNLLINGLSLSSVEEYYQLIIELAMFEIRFHLEKVL